MQRSTKVLLAATALLSGALLARPLLTPAPAHAQAITALPQSSEVGRYNMVQGKDSLYFLDTKTGRFWYHEVTPNPNGRPHSEWREATSPVSPAK